MSDLPSTDNEYSIDADLAQHSIERNNHPSENAGAEDNVAVELHNSATAAMQCPVEPLTEHPERMGQLAIFGCDADIGSFSTAGSQLVEFYNTVPDNQDDQSSSNSSDFLPQALDEFESLQGLKPVNLRDYQNPLAEKSLRGENDIILLPTGAGKTYIAIKIIIEHLHEYKDKKPKVVFFAPTNVLALQQYQKIQECLNPEWRTKCRKVTGHDNVEPNWLIDIMKGDNYIVLVVTPAIISNYLEISTEASMSDFSLFIFDEYHNALQDKEHHYNKLVMKSMWLRHQAPPETKFPQLIGLTATIGIGDSNSQDQATDYVLDMCAKIGLQSAPSQPSDVSAIMNCPEEEYTNTDFMVESKPDEFSQYIQGVIMQKLETAIKVKFDSELLSSYGSTIPIKFPGDRLAKHYEAYVVMLRKLGPVLSTIQDKGVQAEVIYCMKALKHLKICYEALQLNHLLNSEQTTKFLKKTLEQNPEYAYEGLAELYDELLSERFRGNKTADQGSIVKTLISKLGDLLSQNPTRKIIIFVMMRTTAKGLAELLNNTSDVFRAVAFTSFHRSMDEGGTKQKDQISARQGFENGEYNILTATSVLEEGIDIKECDVVVRYMYVKDMIAKIQSKGRARRENALIYTILTTKMMEKERENEYKENLMYQAMLEIRVMSAADFKTKMEERQVKLLVTAEQMLTRQIPAPVLPREGPIKCSDCQALLGYMSHVRGYCASHHLILDASLHEKVIAFRDKSFQFDRDGLSAQAILLCNGKKERDGDACKNRVASLVSISGYCFGMWCTQKKGGTARGVHVDGKKLKKYKEVRHNILPITLKELLELAPLCQFPRHLLKDKDT